MYLIHVLSVGRALKNHTAHTTAMRPRMNASANDLCSQSMNQT